MSATLGKTDGALDGFRLLLGDTITSEWSINREGLLGVGRELVFLYVMNKFS